MNAYETYVMFLAIKRHFTTKDYDGFKYNFKIKTSVQAFEKRNDRYFFDKLSRFEDPRGLIIAGCTRDDPNKLFIGSLIRDNKYALLYKDYKNTLDAIDYTVETQLSTLHGDDFKVKHGQHPRIIDRYFQKDLHLETLVAVQREGKVLDYWNKHIRDTLIFPDLAMKIEKYAPFVRYDKARIRKALFTATES